MSAISGWFGRHTTDGMDRTVRSLQAMAQRGDGAWDTAVDEDGAGAVGVSRFKWECAATVAGPCRVAGIADWDAVADATLYYRDDLVRSCGGAGCRPSAALPATELILHAYRLWGRDCLSRLEGDYAFIVRHRSTREVFAARDFAGKRPLFWAETDEGLAIASTIEGVVAAGGIEPRVDPFVLALNAAGIPAPDDRTHYLGIHVLPAGHELRWRPGARAKVRSWWRLPEGATRAPFEDAAHELRALLTRAVAERAASTTAVWLSGGRDSTAVLGAGRAAGEEVDWRAVSVSYPEGDPGREDEIIADVVAHCGVPISWIDSETIPVFDPTRRVRRRAGPLGHAFAGWIGSLARASRGTGATVSLDGYGGDQLFQASDVYLADVFRGGNLVRWVREWRHPQWRSRGSRDFLRWSLKPLLPGLVRSAIAASRGGAPVLGHLDRTLPPWMTAPVVARLDADGCLAAPARARGEGHARREMRWYLTDPYFPAISSLVAELALAPGRGGGGGGGVEVRSPLMDERVLRLAWTRPDAERYSDGDAKVLLRRAMDGLLPASVLAPRPHRTGTTEGYLGRRLRSDLAAMGPGMLDRSRLADLGLIEPAVFRKHWHRFVDGADATHAVALLATLQVDRWLGAGSTPRRTPSLAAVAG